MPDKDINFLPKDMQSKKQASHDKEEVEFSNPKAVNSSGKDKADNNIVANDKKQSQKNKHTSTSQSQNLSRERQDILSNIKNQQIGITSDTEVKNKESDAPFLLKRWRQLTHANPASNETGSSHILSKTTQNKYNSKDTKSDNKSNTMSLFSKKYTKNTEKANTKLSAASTAEMPPAINNTPLVGTNLIHGQEFAFFNWKQAIFTNLAIVGVAVIVVISMWSVLAMLDSKEVSNVNPLQQNLAQKESTINNLKAEAAQYSNVRTKAKLAKNILDKHIYWTNFFNFLEDNTLTDVYYSNFNGDLSGQYTFAALAKDFNTFTAQIKLWQNEHKYTNQAVIASMRNKESEEGSVVEFSLDLDITPDIFYK